MSLLVSSIKYSAVRPNIFIESSIEFPDFSDKVKGLIERIEVNPIGRRLFEKISHYTLPMVV